MNLFLSLQGCVIVLLGFLAPSCKHICVIRVFWLSYQSSPRIFLFVFGVETVFRLVSTSPPATRLLTEFILTSIGKDLKQLLCLNIQPIHLAVLLFIHSHPTSTCIANKTTFQIYQGHPFLSGYPDRNEMCRVPSCGLKELFVSTLLRIQGSFFCG